MEQLVNDLLDLLVEIQQIPAPTFAEMQRAQFVQARFLAEGCRMSAWMDRATSLAGCLALRAGLILAPKVWLFRLIWIRSFQPEPI